MEILQTIGYLLLFAAVCFVQNMAFTWSGRSRTSGDPDYHRYAAWASNGVWFFCQMFLYHSIWSQFKEGNIWMVALGGVIYTISTTEGSVYMMRRMIKTETGKRKVGA